MAVATPLTPLVTVCLALQQGRRLALRYRGVARVVEVHACGLGAGKQALMLVWQVRGGSLSGQSTGWKDMRLDHVRNLVITQDPSQAPRPGYRGLPALVTVLCQIPVAPP